MISNVKPHKLLILSQHCDNYKQLIEEKNLPGLSIITCSNPNDLNKNEIDIDLVLGEPTLVAMSIDHLPSVGWVQSTWAGIEPLMMPDLRHDYILTNVRNVYGPLISEYVFGYILMVEKQILTRFKSQKERRWESSINGTLKGKLLGVAGVGTIGSHIAYTAKHFGMRVFGYTRKSEDCEAVDGYFHHGAWRDFARNLDYLVCTLPGTQETINFIDANALSVLPEKSWLINVGRGSTIDETALVNALENGAISGAILDVFKEEPLPKDSPLWSTPNTFVTCHTAAQNYPPDIATVFIENYQHLLRGEPLQYNVDFRLGY